MKAVSVLLFLTIFLLIILFICIILLIRKVYSQNDLIEEQAGKISAYERLMDCSHDLYWIKDRNYRLQFVNKEYKKLFPTVDDFVGKTDHDLVDAVLADGYKAGDEKVMSSGQEFPYQENDKGELWFESIKIPVFKGTDRLVVGCAGMAHNITENKVQEVRVYELEHLDYLSGLANRYSFVTEYRNRIDNSIKEGLNVGLVLLHIDRFSNVNALNGFDAGDELLRKISFELRKVAKEFKLQLSSVGGDDFGFVVDNNPQRSDVIRLIRKLQAVFSSPFELSGLHLNLSCSIGVSIAPENADSFEVLYRNAELCMHVAKQKNKNKVTFYEDIDAELILKNLAIEFELSFALAREEFYIVYQPKIDLKTGKTIGSEALLRWHNERLGEVAPLEFLDIASRMRNIIEIGYWQIEKIITQNLEWGACGYHMLPIAVNLNETQFFDENLTKTVSELLIKYNYPGNLIEFEISENNFVSDCTKSCRILRELHDLGIKVSIDDFGIDFFSMLNIAKLDVDCVKINRQYLASLGLEQHEQEMLKAIIEAINKSKIDLMVSNVEQQDELEQIKKLQIGMAQGFLYKEPLSSVDYESYLRKGN